jgi:hypothetical protein
MIQAKLQGALVLARRAGSRFGFIGFSAKMLQFCNTPLQMVAGHGFAAKAIE